MNPELRRNLWLEATPARAMMTIVVLFLLVLAASLAAGRDEAADSCLWMAAALGVLWGPRLAAQSLLGEIAANTWDMQRAGALSGWQMAIGKLAGSTAIAWFGIALCWAAAFGLGGSRGPADWRDLVLLAWLAQAGALFAALVLAAAARGGRAIDGFAAQIAGIAFALGVRSMVAITFDSADRFWGAPSAPWMAPAAMLAMALLATGGCWWRMADALQAPSGLFVWPLFLACIGFLAGGSAYGQLPWEAAAFAAILPIAWLALLVDPKPPVALRVWMARPDLAGTPAWLLGFGFLLVLAVWMAVAGSTAELRGARDLLPSWMEGLPWRIAAIPVLLFFLRDVALFHLIAWGGVPGRGLVAALVYAAVLYGLLPTILSAAEGGSLLWLLLPVPGAPLVQSLAAPLLQCLALGFLAARRLQALTPGG